MYFKLDSWAPHITYLESTGVRWDPGTYDFHNHPGNCNATVHQITLWETPQPKEGEMVDEWGFRNSHYRERLWSKRCSVLRRNLAAEGRWNRISYKHPFCVPKAETADYKGHHFSKNYKNDAFSLHKTHFLLSTGNENTIEWFRTPSIK